MISTPGEHMPCLRWAHDLNPRWAHWPQPQVSTWSCLRWAHGLNPGEHTGLNPGEHTGLNPRWPHGPCPRWAHGLNPSCPRSAHGPWSQPQVSTWSLSQVSTWSQPQVSTWSLPQVSTWSQPHMWAHGPASGEHMVSTPAAPGEQNIQIIRAANPSHLWQKAYWTNCTQISPGAGLMSLFDVLCDFYRYTVNVFIITYYYICSD
jgi:hypothetical protein